MTRGIPRCAMRAAALIAILSCASIVVLAGPPLVCWKVETGGAKSLPWDNLVRNFNGTSAEYDTKRLAADTLALLGSDVAVLARMETLRRAALYAARDQAAGEELLSRLVARAKQTGGGRMAEGLAYFDAGYLVEAWKQGALENPQTSERILKTVGLMSSGPPKKSLDGQSGYDWVLMALKLRDGDPEIEYAAALITWHPPQPSHEGHFARAVAGARDGTPLAANLLRNFDNRGKTLDELRTSAALAKR